jgi:hypothetical protein
VLLHLLHQLIGERLPGEAGLTLAQRFTDGVLQVGLGADSPRDIDGIHREQRAGGPGLRLGAWRRAAELGSCGEAVGAQQGGPGVRGQSKGGELGVGGGITDDVALTLGLEV